MSKPQVFSIVFEGASENTFRPGQLVNGHVLVILSERIKITGIRLQISGTGYVSWNDPSNNSQHFGQESYVNLEILLLGSDDPTSELNLEACIHKFPFSFPLPQNLPRSFECAFGYVRYKATALLDRLAAVDVSEDSVMVQHSLDLNQEPQHLREPLVIQSQSMENTCCWAKGFVDISLSVNRGCFVPGEKVHMDGTIVNRTNGPIDSLTIALVQDLELFAISPNDLGVRATTHSLTTLLTIDRRPLKRGEQDQLDDVSFVVPSVPPSRLEGCKLFNVTYLLKVTTVFFCDCRSSSSICREIVIGDYGFPSEFQPYVVTHQPQVYPMSFLSTAATLGYPEPMAANSAFSSGNDAPGASDCIQNFPQSTEVPPFGSTTNDFRYQSVEHCDLAAVRTTFSRHTMSWDLDCESRPDAYAPGYNISDANCATPGLPDEVTVFSATDLSSCQADSMNGDGTRLSEAHAMEFSSSCDAYSMSNDCIGMTDASTGGCSTSTV